MPLALLTCHFNPGGFLTPRRNLSRFLRQMEAQGVPVYAAELAYGDAPFVLEEHQRTLRLRCDPGDALWHKENLLNLLERRVPARYDALAWVDHDVWFQRAEWRQATERALETHAVAQMFDKAVWSAEDGGVAMSDACAMKNPAGHPGFAWAARRGLWRDSGGLYEGGILGGADRVMLAAWLGQEREAYDFTAYADAPAEVARLRAWCAAHGGAGVVSGTLHHEWHGNLKHRGYMERHAVTRGLDAAMITRREDGLLVLDPATPPVIRRRIASYFRSRMEDGSGGGPQALSDARFLPRLAQANLSGWSILEDDYRWLWSYARSAGARRVVEFGPGDSTLALLDAGCEILSFESDAARIDGLREQWKHEPRVEIRHCAADAVPEDLDFTPDLVFVDGPPARAAKMRRLPACDWAAARCARVLLHDALRDDESAILDLFRARGWNVELVPTLKGLGVMERPAPHSRSFLR